jgi:broad-specificity NMP kinase
MHSCWNYSQRNEQFVLTISHWVWTHVTARFQVVVLTTDNTILYDRLVKRGYSQHKVEENVQCEIMQVRSPLFASDTLGERMPAVTLSRVACVVASLCL